jgi:hypothetical protein
MAAAARVFMDAALGPVTDEEATWFGKEKTQRGTMFALNSFAEARKARLLAPAAKAEGGQ